MYSGLVWGATVYRRRNKTDIQGLIRLAGERFRAFEKQGCFLRGSFLQAGVFPSEVVDSARDLTEGKTEPKCARFCCIDQDGAEVTISSFLADPLTCSLLFNRSRESRESGFMQRYRIQLAFERGELPTSPLSGKKGQEPQAPCEIAKKIHSLNRVTFVVKNGITVAQCTCLDFGQRGLCPDSAAALELANLINLKALSESMLPVCRGRKAVPLPTAKQIFRGVGAAAADSVPPCAHFRAEPGLGAKAGAQRGATGKSGRCYIGVRVSKVFQEAGRQPAVFYGQVTRCRNSDGALLWNVRYDDSDQEELDEDGVMNAVALYAALAAANGNSPPVKKSKHRAVGLESAGASEPASGRGALGTAPGASHYESDSTVLDLSDFYSCCSGSDSNDEAASSPAASAIARLRELELPQAQTGTYFSATGLDVNDASSAMTPAAELAECRQELARILAKRGVPAEETGVLVDSIRGLIRKLEAQVAEESVVDIGIAAIRGTRTRIKGDGNARAVSLSRLAVLAGTHGMQN